VTLLCGCDVAGAKPQPELEPIGDYLEAITSFDDTSCGLRAQTPTTPGPTVTATPLSKANCALISPVPCVPSVVLYLQNYPAGLYKVEVDLAMTDGSTRKLHRLVFVVGGLAAAAWEFSGADPADDPSDVYGVIVTPVR
jgi:hypothetical protein